MSLDMKQREKMSSWLDEKQFPLNCPVCGDSEWCCGNIIEVKVHEESQRLSVAQELGAERAKETAVLYKEMVQVVCRNCYHILLFAAEPIGLFEK